MGMRKDLTNPNDIRVLGITASREAYGNIGRRREGEEAQAEPDITFTIPEGDIAPDSALFLEASGRRPISRPGTTYTADFSVVSPHATQVAKIPA